ncbi:MAG: DUF1501 domain-containing protein [Verrucomicrobiales bacterium]|jgi:hypothetical protein|nr:DUF1501 domain-containing protein [Verrucomicrobiales bacterium]
MKKELLSLDPLSRRHFAEKTAAAAFGLSLMPSMDEAMAATTTAGKAKHVIYIYMGGGMTHLDTFDPKPGAETQGQTGTVSTGVAGIELSEYMPDLAKRFKDIAVVRSLTQKTGAHGGASYWMQTGYQETPAIRHPNMGGWAQKALGKMHPQLPDTIYVGGGGPGSGFLGASYAPLPIGDPSKGLPNSKAPVKKPRMDERLAALEGFNQSFLDKYQTEDVQAYSQFYDNTLDFLKGKDLDVFDLSKEKKEKRDAYGNGFGQGLLLAKRLVKTGVRFVRVTNGGWDMHGDLWNRGPGKINGFSKGIATLIDDLKAEGLFDETLIVLTTEFGRTPKINARGGRDHHPRCFSAMLAGGGIQGGQVYGETDDKAISVKEDPVTPQDFSATIATALGLPLEKRIFAPNGRPFFVANGGEPIMPFFS